MHFTLILLFCSLISINAAKKYERDVHPASVDGLDALVRRKRQVLGVEPIDFLHEQRLRWKHSLMHPAVLVDIKDEKALVVVISKSFKKYSVPPHLRGDVKDYFDEGTTTNALGLGEKGPPELKGELDLSMFRVLKWGDVSIANSGEFTTMAEDKFDKMIAKIESNRATRGIKPFVPRDGASEELASATPQGEKRKLDSVEEGQIVHVQTKVGAHRWDTYLAIFVSWTGNSSLAIVSISGDNYNAHSASNKIAKIADYQFGPDNYVKDAYGKLVRLSGVISLDDYQFVHSKNLTLDCGLDTRVMKYESYKKLRHEIDTNYEENRKNLANVEGRAPPQDKVSKMGQKKLSLPGPSSTTTTVTVAEAKRRRKRPKGPGPKRGQQTGPSHQ